jgi:hypothetical protein
MVVRRSYDLVHRMRELGADDAQGWAESELREDIAQEARWLVVRHLWRTAIDCHKPGTVTRTPSAARAVAAGANPVDVAQAMRAAAYEAVFTVLDTVDEGYDPAAPQDAPGWRLMELRFDHADDDGTLSGRNVGGLHEDILMADPSGRDGADLWQ